MRSRSKHKKTVHYSLRKLNTFVHNEDIFLGPFEVFAGQFMHIRIIAAELNPNFKRF